MKINVNIYVCMCVQGDHVDAARILLHHKAPVDEVSTVPDLPLPP